MCERVSQQSDPHNCSLLPRWIPPITHPFFVWPSCTQPALAGPFISAFRTLGRLLTRCASASTSRPPHLYPSHPIQHRSLLACLCSLFSNSSNLLSASATTSRPLLSSLPLPHLPSNYLFLFQLTGSNLFLCFLLASTLPAFSSLVADSHPPSPFTCLVHSSFSIRIGGQGHSLVASFVFGPSYNSFRYNYGPLIWLCAHKALSSPLRSPPSHLSLAVSKKLRLIFHLVAGLRRPTYDRPGEAVLRPLSPSILFPLPHGSRLL